MAAFDEESDDDESVSTRPLPNSAVLIKGHEAPAARPTNASRMVDAPRDDEDDGEEEDEVVCKPRGRMAARMAGVAPPIQEESSESSEDEDVYQRIRRDLMASRKSPPVQEMPAKVNHTVEVSRVETPQLSPPRKRLSKLVQRASTPASVRSESPGLFMSPAPVSRRSNDGDTGHSSGSGSDSDLPADPTASSRFRELVERRRAERLAREQAEREAEEERAESGQAPLSDLFQDEDTRDEPVEKRLTQHARPTRKASKKALEEMNRETQRMKRNMQLTHQAKVKKRFTAQDFLSNFSRSKPTSGLANVFNAADITSSSPPPAPSSDAGADKDRDTPPSSPPSGEVQQKNVQESRTDVPLADVSDEEMPSLEEIMTQPGPKLDNNKGKAPVRDPSVGTRQSIRRYRVKIPTATASLENQDEDDDDLEIVKNRFAMFDQVPKMQTPEARTMLMLRHLAQLKNPEKAGRLKKGQKPSITLQQLEAELRNRAREIANQERADKLAELRAKGIIILSEEDREREQLQIEDMLSKAREEADKLRKQEKATAKANGEDVLASSDESEDEDYIGSGEEDATAAKDDEENDEEEEMEYSGSEEEDHDETNNDHDMIDGEASEDDLEQRLEHEDNDGQEEATVHKSRRIRRKHIVEDDEDEDDDEPVVLKDQNSGAGINDELAAAFGFAKAPSAPMGMSQMFAGTMAESQTQDDTQPSVAAFHEQDSLEMLRHIPSAPIPTMPTFEDSQDDVADSQSENVQVQTEEPTQQIDLHLSHALADSPSVNPISQYSQIPDPSQDVGFAPDRTPLAARVATPSSTVETVMLGIPESPAVQRRGRLLRRSEANQPLEEEEEEDETVPSSAPVEHTAASDAFAVMRQAAKRPAQPDFDKKKSNAKGMVDEQAEESEDEYAGLGGASEDEDAGSGDEDDKQMIDESDVKVDERKLAALYAEKARAQDEAQTSKLYKDLMSGALRRKRGANAFELDSDEDDQLAERRRRRQREEARKRKLLLQDESLGKLGANDKKEAFLRAIEDRDEADNVDFLDGVDVDDDEDMQDSQPNASQQVSEQLHGEAPLAQVSGNSLKRAAEDSEPSQSSQQQPRKKPSSLRRSNPWDTFRKPKSLAEVRESVSFLIDEPHNDEVAAGILLSDSEHEDNAAAVEARAPAAERRIPAKAGIIDRLTLKKQASSSVAEDSADALAFATSSQSRGSFSFKPASLLRKATANNTSFSESMPPPALNREGSSNVRVGGSKKSSINYQAREAERQALVHRAERKRAENVRKIAGLRRKAGGALGALGSASGSFE